MGFQFGSFQSVCENAALVVCPLLGIGNQGIAPKCYSRSVDVAGTLIFQPSTSFVHIVAIIMTIIMLLHVRSKYTAVGRKEILVLFWLYIFISLLAMFLDSEVIPTSNKAYPWFAAIYTGLVAAAYCCLLVNGFVGFQFAEDGTMTSLWILRGSCLVLFALGFLIAAGTFFSKAGFSGEKPTALYVIYLIWPVICVLAYVVSQLILILRTLDDRWPIGDILFGTAFFAIAQVLLFAFSITICDAVRHYFDGLFFYAVCMLLSIMMVYKYWDSITKEDLEFSVGGSKAAVWEVKDPLLSGSLAPPNQYGGGGSGSNSDDGSWYEGPPKSRRHTQGY